MRTVAFYSYKGGVGRTLLLANAARFLALAGKKVVALDLDLEAPGLHYKLGSLDVLSRARDGRLRGAVDELLDVLSNVGGRPVADFAVTVDLPQDCRGSLYLIPAGSAPSTQYWMTLAKLGQITKIESIDGGIVDAVLDLQARIADDLAPDFLLVDARTGITELGGLATTIVADRVVCLTSTSPESIDGTLTVASALRTVPRLPGQNEIEIEFLLTRVDVVGPPGAALVPSEAEIELLRSRVDSEGSRGRQSEFRLAFSAILPHDRTIANEERVLGGERTHDRRATLFEASLAWIEKSFSSLASEAGSARKRMAAVDRAWHELTDDLQGSPPRTERGRRWPVDCLRVGVRVRSTYDDIVSERFADIVAYDLPTSEPEAKPLLVVEYVENEDLEHVARWWHRTGDFRIVCLLGEKPSDRQLFTRTFNDTGLRRSDRWDLPMPHDFAALRDPADISVETLINAVQRGYHDYVARLTSAWMLTSLYPEGQWHGERARQILDGFAGIDDVETAKQVLRRVSPNSDNRKMWMRRNDDSGVDDQVWRGLFTPLWWRLPVEASIAVAEESSLHGPPFGCVALRMLAEEFLGLRYDPDTTFRRKLDAAIERLSGWDIHDQARSPDIYAVDNAFRTLEIAFEERASLPPITLQAGSLRDEADRPGEDIDELTQRLIQNRFVVTTGFLGNYEPEHARVVLFDTAIDAVASRLALPRRRLATITLLHETVHAITHVGRDLDGRMWPEFALPSAASPLFEPSRFHAAIAQYFSYRFLLHLGDRALLECFEKLTDSQPRAYQEWREMKDLPLEEMRSWLMSVRREAAGTPGRAIQNERGALSLARREGKEEGLRESIVALCEVFGLDLSAERKRELQALDAWGLKALMVRLRAERRWP